MSTGRLIGTIAETGPSLRPSEQRVASLVLKDAERAARMSISTLARAADVSEPTVLRFCRSLGFGGFIDFKLALAGDLAGGTPFVDQDVTASDTSPVIAAKLYGSTIRALSRLQESLDHAALSAAVDSIQQARRIDICGIAQSNFVASDLQHRLARMGYAAVSLSDAHMQMQAVASSDPRDVVVIMSFAGQIRETVTIAKLAHEAGATVVAITRSTSALARAADIVLNVDTNEKTFLYASTATRFAHLLVVDILTTTLALRGGDAMVERLRRSRLATRDHWLPEADE